MTACIERRTLLAVLVLLLVLPLPSSAQDTAAFYADNCATCHTIGGGAHAGPDLRGVTAHRDREWLIRFLLDPEQVVKSGDRTAVELVSQWDGAIMPPTPGLTRALAEDLLRFIERESARGAAATVVQEPEAAVTEEDVQLGRALFEGRQRFERGTAPCLACHDVSGSRALGGGTLGPDLTQSYSRLGGRRGLQAWLEAPPTRLMRALYRPAPLTANEARALTAMFSVAPDAPAHDKQRRTAVFGAGGAALTLLGLGLAGAAWRRRFTAVRAPMVAAARIHPMVRPGGTR